MFAVIYRWQVLPGCEAQLRRAGVAAPKRIAAGIRRLGKPGCINRLTAFIAYAQWPDEDAWKKKALKPAHAPFRR